jgi:hypothetical protein
MIETLYVNGCSWTAGNELETDPEFLKFMRRHRWRRQDPDDDINWNLINRRGQVVCTADQHFDLFNWAGELKKLIGANTLINAAAGGGSNDRVVRTTIEYVRTLSPLQRSKTLIVIGWTLAERSEIMVGQHWQRFNPAQLFSETADRQYITDQRQLTSIDQTQQYYLSTIFNDRQRVHNYIQSVYLLSNLLDNLGIHYYFFNALPAWWTAGSDQVSFDVVTEFSSDLLWQEQHRHIHSRHDTMFGYVHKHNLPTARYGHPLSQAHKKWAQHLFGYMHYKNIL